VKRRTHFDLPLFISIEDSATQREGDRKGAQTKDLGGCTFPTFREPPHKWAMISIEAPAHHPSTNRASVE
jgi:hypothetical protein